LVLWTSPIFMTGLDPSIGVPIDAVPDTGPL
jgi:hypothetical protein